MLGIDLGIGLGISQRQTGDPAYRETLLDAARRAADLGLTDRLVEAALANDRGWVTSSSRVDADKVEVLERALALLPSAGADRARVLAMLCQESQYGTTLERRQELADEAIATARS